MSNLDFVAKWDVDSFKRKCREQRELAERYPAYDRRMGTVEEYRWQMGPWQLIFLLEAWEEPAVWHGSAACVEQVGWKTVRDKLFQVEVPEDALLATKSWVPDHYEQARFILAEIFGPILRPDDSGQEALESVGLMALHWHVKVEGTKWQRGKYLH